MINMIWCVLYLFVAGFVNFACVFVFETSVGDTDSGVEAVDKISVLYFWQSHLAVDVEKRGEESYSYGAVGGFGSVEWNEVQRSRGKQRWKEAEREAPTWPCSQKIKQTKGENLFSTKSCIIFTVTQLTCQPIIQSQCCLGHIHESLSSSLFLLTMTEDVPVF